MIPWAFRIKSFISWWLEAVDEHSLHSPFFFDLYTRHIRPGSIKFGEKFTDIEGLRRKLLHDRRLIPVEDLGSGRPGARKRRISRIAQTSLSPARFSSLYSRLIHHFDARNIVELGTSFGINTLYLAHKSDAQVTTFEGSPAIAEIASLTFEFAGRKDIRLMEGNIEKTLPRFLQQTGTIDFAFMDANHRYEPTLRYFGWLLRKVSAKSVIVLDDIHHSAEMERAWNTVRNHRLVYATADLFRCGIVFFDPSLNKQHVILQV